MGTTYKYEKLIKNEILGKEKIIRAQTKEEFDEKKKRQEQEWEQEVSRQIEQQAAIIRTQEQREYRKVLDTLLIREVRKGIKPEWKNRGSVGWPYPPFHFNEPAPTYFDSAKLFPMPEFDSWLPQIFQMKIQQQRKEAFENIHRHQQKAQAKHEERRAQAYKEYKEQRRKYFEQQNDSEIIVWILGQVLQSLHFPFEYGTEFEFEFVEEDQEVVVYMFLPRVDEIPTVAEYRYVRSRNETDTIHLKQKELQGNYEKLLAQIALGTMFRIFQDAQTPRIQSIVFNGCVSGIHPATGVLFKRCVLTVQATRSEFDKRNFELLKPVECLRDLRGLTAGPLIDLSPIKPIRAFPPLDERFIDTDNVLANYPAMNNIARIHWREFEHMIAELFHRIFEEFGGEVHLTPSSGDGGVDAIGFDPDPIRGGKIVIQAKHYPNRLVSPVYVRELLGVMTAKRATRGYLATSGYFSKDSHEYATEHNITLFDGPRLLHELQTHGFPDMTFQV